MGLGYSLTAWFGTNLDKKMSDYQCAILYEPVHCTGFSLFQFLQGVEVPEEHIPSQSMTPSVSIEAQNVQHTITDA